MSQTAKAKFFSYLIRTLRLIPLIFKVNLLLRKQILYENFIYNFYYMKKVLNS
jgi:hypothetical protein